MIAVICPSCAGSAVIRFGKNSCGTARLRCKACKKTWTPDARDRSLSLEKEAAIVGALAERLSQRGIARALKVSRDTVRAVRKKAPPE